MRKSNILFTIFLLVFVLTGCKSNNEVTSDAQSSVIQETEESSTEESSIEVTVSGSEESTTESLSEVEEIINPLSEKEYDLLEINESTDFYELCNNLIEEHKDYIYALGDYLGLHSKELADGSRFCDFTDYEATFNDIYEWTYKITKQNIDEIPEEYKDFWVALVEFAEYNIGVTDAAYTQNQEKLIESLTAFSEEVEGKINSVKALLPVPTIQIGEKIVTDAFEFTLVNVELSYDVKPQNPPTYYSHYVADSGQVYVHVDADVKNTQKQDIRCDKIYSITVDYNDGYQYSGFNSAEDTDGDFTYANITSITPLQILGVHALADCPKEVEENKENPLFVIITFNDGSQYKYTIR